MSEIVLLDTNSDFDNIQCISVPFDEDVPEYCAISYRWGRHCKWEAPTPNYIASITSVSQGNLIKLCKLYRQRIPYLWIDVVCINQADKAHRKMAIKNMDNIYRRAKYIIAVPDLCYCDEYPIMEDVTKEDIEVAIVDFASSFLGFRFDADDPLDELPDIELDPFEYPSEDVWRCLKRYSYLKQQSGNKSNGNAFLNEIMYEWAMRAWVVSERLIGVKDNKLVIHILRHFNLNPGDVVVTILDSYSTKYIDRLYAILPHTHYAHVLQKLVDDDVTVDNDHDLRWLLFDIVDEEDRCELFQVLVDKLQFSDINDHPIKLSPIKPSPCRIDDFNNFADFSGSNCFDYIDEIDYFYVLSFFAKDDTYFLSLNDHFDSAYFFTIEATRTQYGRPVVKVSCPFTIVLVENEHLDMFLCYEQEENSIDSTKEYDGYLCRKSNGVWKLIENTYFELPGAVWRYGEFHILV
ncbi:hypothetical protein EC973_002953 [Apophysomyces ossiformis]|uniref:Heterokaryon incompatibility domain-containing protein n=1 Tax=Apophysomyces ossiformis TaxID=679940 RepID=A0A8H7BHP5_9FUNG|nr:hypothetical protein EC973_002953 [Apophysomyces ossiformis]